MINDKKDILVLREVGKDIPVGIGKQIINNCKNFKKLIPTIEVPRVIPKIPPVYVSNENNYIKMDGSDNNNDDRMKGLDDLWAIYLDEADRFSYEFFEQVQMSLRGMVNQKFIVSFNPVSIHHWLKKKFLDSYEFLDMPKFVNSNNPKIREYSRLSEYSFSKRSSCGTIAYFNTTYRDNFFISGHPAGERYGFLDQGYIDRIEKLKLTNPNNHKIYSFGEWGNPSEGLVWCYIKDFNKLETRDNKIYYSYYSELPDLDFYIIYGLDFGGGGGLQGDECDGKSKTVVKKYYINKATRSVYHELLMYKGYIDDAELELFLKENCTGGLILSDNARSDKITYMLNRGVNVVGAKTREGKSSGVNSGIDILKTWNHYILESSLPEKTERENHRWEISPKTNEPSGQVEDKYKDITDADRYAIVFYTLNYP